LRTTRLLRLISRSLTGKFVVLAVMFLIVPVMLYVKFSQADTERRNFLVRSLQVEGRLAAEAVLAGPAGAAARYRAAVARDHLAYHRVAAAAHSALVSRPAAAAMVGRVLTHPLLGRGLAGGWSVFWNELLDGAPAGPSRTVAVAASLLGRKLTRRSATGRWLDQVWATEP